MRHRLDRTGHPPRRLAHAPLPLRRRPGPPGAPAHPPRQARPRLQRRRARQRAAALRLDPAGVPLRRRRRRHAGRAAPAPPAPPPPPRCRLAMRRTGNDEAYEPQSTAARLAGIATLLTLFILNGG